MSALNIKKGSTSHSAYDLRDSNAQVEESHTLAVIVENEPGVLARVIGLFSGRGYNIDSLTVAEVDHTGHRSRITIVTRGTPQVLDQIEAQLQKMVSTRHVQNVTKDPDGVERELALIKVRGKGDARNEAARLADIFRAKIIDVTETSYVVELTGTSQKLDAFIQAVPEGLVVEVVRSGPTGIARGEKGLTL